jgi:hypothetical protein
LAYFKTENNIFFNDIKKCHLEKRERRTPKPYMIPLLHDTLLYPTMLYNFFIHYIFKNIVLFNKYESYWDNKTENLKKIIIWKRLNV